MIATPHAHPAGFEQLPVLDLFSDDLREHSIEVLAELRRAGPLCQTQPFGGVGVLRFDDVDAVLRDFRTYSSDVEVLPPLPGAERQSEIRTLIRQDPPEHARVRALVRQALSLPRLEAMERRIRKMVRELVGGIMASGRTFDLLDDLAVPLPVTVIAELLGVNPDDRARFKRWSDDLLGRSVVHYSKEGPARDARIGEITASLLEMDAYLEEAIARRRREPHDDLISSFVQACEAGDVLTEEEIVSLVRLLLIAGNETTTRLLGLAMNAFLHHPGQLEILAESPELTASAVEETLRYEGPVISLTRITTKETTIAGLPIPAGTLVSPVIASANHDESVFPDPSRFDIRRKGRRHIGFGGGVHACVGAPIARVEMRIALEEMIASMDRIEAAGPAVRVGGFLRGFEKMPLRFVPRVTSVGAKPPPPRVPVAAGSHP